jgi:hypothetical protein
MTSPADNSAANNKVCEFERPSKRAIVACTLLTYCGKTYYGRDVSPLAALATGVAAAIVAKNTSWLALQLFEFWAETSKTYCEGKVFGERPFFQEGSYLLDQ